MKKTEAKQKKEKAPKLSIGGSAQIEGNINLGTINGDMTYESTRVKDVGPGAQVMAGKQANVEQYQGITERELVEVQKLFDIVRTELKNQDLPELTKSMGEDCIDQIEQEITKEDAPPDGGVIKVAGNWLLKNIPAIAGTLANMFINPIVGKVVEAAGEVASEWVKEKFYSDIKGA